VWLDIGGGFPYDHSVPLEDQPFSPLLFFETIADAWSAALRPPLLTEPGRFIAAPSMAIVSRVLSRKPRSGEPTIVVLDSGTNHNVMAAFYEHLWSCADAAQPACRYRFCGPLCMEDDILSGEKLASLPSAGSLVAVFNSGAYSLALSRTFIQPRPAVFALRADGSHKLLVPAESAEQAYGFAFRMEHPRIDGRTGTRSGDEASG
jgi:ornithine decarboxylase